jgi:hypothetical protein
MADTKTSVWAGAAATVLASVAIYYLTGQNKPPSLMHPPPAVIVEHAPPETVVVSNLVPAQPHVADPVEDYYYREPVISKMEGSWFCSSTLTYFDVYINYDGGATMTERRLDGAVLGECLGSASGGFASFNCREFSFGAVGVASLSDNYDGTLSLLINGGVVQCLLTRLE